jgi:hypothetical protein
MPYVLIALTVLLRLIPHPFNLAPVGALGLFAGAYCSPRFAWLVPLLALGIGDALSGGYDSIVMLFVYAGFLGGPVIGRLLLAQHRTPLRFVGSTLIAATVFFIVSNFGIWAAGMYPATFSGLVDCYVNAIPYFGTTLTGDFAYGVFLFGAAELAQRFMGTRNAVSSN